MSCVETYSSHTHELVTELAKLMTDRNMTVTTAESCTGGMLSAAITELSGSSEWFEFGAITYSNAVKGELLDVPENVFIMHGAVSEACVCAMAEGALRRSGANVAISVSGIAGPTGAMPGKPVGTVWIAWAQQVQSKATVGSDASGTVLSSAQSGIDTSAERFQFSGDRQAVRQQAVLSALRGIIRRIALT